MPVVQSENHIINLDGFGLLEVTGEDAKSFLQSQLTSDISTLVSGESQYSSWCNPQGRIISTFIIHSRDTGFIFMMPSRLIEGFKRKLSMYILRSKVKIDILDSSTRIIGICGKTLLTRANQYICQNDKVSDAILMPVPGIPLARAILIATSEIEQAICSHFSDINKAPNDTYWQYLDINSGIVWVNDKTTEKLLPQDIGLEKFDALSFSKGCFPGQEIIARLHYRGKEKYGLYRGVIADTRYSPVPGDRLYLPADDNNIGMIVSVVKLDNKYHCLASLNHNFHQPPSFSIEKKWDVNISFSEV